MSIFVTDTHPLVWHASGKNRQLSTKVITAFQQAETENALIYIPAIVLLEIALLEKLGKVKLRDGFYRWSTRLLAKRGFAVAPLETSIIAQAVGYNFNNDPFDGVILATAVELDSPLITKDVAITESNLVEIYW